MSHLAIIIIATLTLWEFSAQCAAPPSSKCPPVAPKTRQEVATMAAASNKKGCWMRNKETGRLEFVAAEVGQPEYKPLTPGAKGPTVSLRAWDTSKNIANNPVNDLSGSWSLTSGTRVADAELPLIHMFPKDIRIIEGVELVGLTTETATFTKRPDGLYCGAAFVKALQAKDKEICFTKRGQNTYVLRTPTLMNENTCEFRSDGRLFRGKCLSSESAGKLFIGERIR